MQNHMHKIKIKMLILSHVYAGDGTRNVNFINNSAVTLFVSKSFTEESRNFCTYHVYEVYSVDEEGKIQSYILEFPVFMCSWVCT